MGKIREQPVLLPPLIYERQVHCRSRSEPAAFRPPSAHTPFVHVHVTEYYPVAEFESMLGCIVAHCDCGSHKGTDVVVCVDALPLPRGLSPAAATRFGKTDGAISAPAGARIPAFPRWRSWLASGPKLVDTRPCALRAAAGSEAGEFFSDLEKLPLVQWLDRYRAGSWHTAERIGAARHGERGWLPLDGMHSHCPSLGVSFRIGKE